MSCGATFLLPAAAAALNSLADVVPVVVHAEDSPVDGEQRPVQTQSHRSVEVLPVLFGHLENDLRRVLYASALRESLGEQSRGRYRVYLTQLVMFAHLSNHVFIALICCWS